jgi:hypothetical protein
MHRAFKPILAGWLNITAGVFWLLAVGVMTLLIVGFSVGFGMPQGAMLLRLWVLLLGFALPGLLAIAGGIASLKRRAWLLALIGAIGTIPTGFGIASVILLVLSKNKFA